MAVFSLFSRKRSKRPQEETGSSIQYRHIVHEQVESTNLCVKSAIDTGQAEGLVVRAASQTAGYGRQGRTWASPQGGLYLSVLLRPTVRLAVLPSLSLVTAVAVCRALRRLLPAETLADMRIKWPNDIILVPASPLSSARPALAPPVFPPQRIKKLCGISLEAYRGAVCLGVGLNVVRPDEAALVEGKNIPVYLDDLGFHGNADDVADAILSEFSRAYSEWREHDLAPFVREFEELLAYRGEVVEVCDIAGKVHARGVLQGIDDGGGLLIEQDGTQSCISSGELRLVAGR